MRLGSRWHLNIARGRSSGRRRLHPRRAALSNLRRVHVVLEVLDDRTDGLEPLDELLVLFFLSLDVLLILLEGAEDLSVLLALVLDLLLDRLEQPGHLSNDLLGSHDSWLEQVWH